jgi:hypothetical protein
MAVLGSFRRALEAIEGRNRGEAIESPRAAEPEHNVALGSTLSAALEGWKKAKEPSRSILFEFDLAVRRFIELLTFASWIEGAAMCASFAKRCRRSPSAVPAP